MSEPKNASCSQPPPAKPQTSCCAPSPAKPQASCCPTGEPQEQVPCCSPGDVPQSAPPEEPLSPEPEKCGDACGASDSVPCCGPPANTSLTYYQVGNVRDGVTYLPSRLTACDTWGGIRARWSSSFRMSYAVAPGLYAIGEPNEDSQVLVTANYKLTLDTLREKISGGNFWILVLDTKGINVWCAAGKGSFGTSELVHRIRESGLTELVSHRSIIVPQLGAPGVAAHLVKQETGFTVIWGPVEADDIPDFIDKGFKATEKMREKAFPARERVALIPIELVPAMKGVVLLQVLFLLLSGVLGKGTFGANLTGAGVFMILALLMAVVSGVLLTPLLLPYLPGRAFSLKSVLPSVLAMAVLVFFTRQGLSLWAVRLEIVGAALMAGALGAFFAMNFTGASTYTSLSGVKKEMRIAVPLQVLAGVSGLILWIVSLTAV